VISSLRLVLPVAALAACTSSRAQSAAGGEMSQKPAISQAASEYKKESQACLETARAGLAQLEALQQPYTVVTVLEPLNELWQVIDRGLNRAGLYRNVHPDAEVRAAADGAEQDFSKLVTDIGLSRPLYEAVRDVDLRAEDAVTKRYVEHMLRDFRRAGVDKDEPTRDKIRALKDELVQIGQAFEKNIREDVRHVTLTGAEVLAGLPADYVEGHKPDAAGAVTLSTDYPDYLPFMTYAKSDTARFALYKAFRQRGYPANAKVLSDLLQRRYALARLLGYENWAAYITEDKMIKTAGAAQAFIDKITQVAAPRAKRDYDELLTQLRKEVPGAREVGDWQKSYVEEQVKREAYKFDSQAARQYFPFGRVRQGLFDITSKMFGVTYTKLDVPVWHPSVEAYEIRDGDTPLGRFYLDLHPRPDKYKHAAAFPIRSGLAGKQLPEASLVCNFPAGESALMEHDEVETFFHEFGHLLHHLFASKGRWVGVSGISTEWDFVEAPSQMLEEWTFDPPTLKTFGKSLRDETIPDTLIASMRRARDFGKGLWVRHQMFYAAVSLGFHNRDPAGLDTDSLMRELQARYSPFGYVPDTHFQLSFGHLEGYSAIYYTYMWSLVIAKDLFSVFNREGLLNVDVARRYRQQVLEPGGSKDAAELVRDFLGRAFAFDSFSTWLNAD
jgi:thimet oligopeptidase